MHHTANVCRFGNCGSYIHLNSSAKHHADFNQFANSDTDSHTDRHGHQYIHSDANSDFNSNADSD